MDVLRKYADFSGRAVRKEYWMFQLIKTIIFAVVGILMVLLTSALHSIGFVFLGILVVYFLAIIIPSLAVSFRRLHDTGRSAWWLLIGLVPYIGSLVILVFTVLDSQPGDNAYGPNPKGVAAPSVPVAMQQ